jgi:hypothetical protein
MPPPSEPKKRSTRSNKKNNTGESRTKKKAGANEAIDIKAIVEGIKTKNGCGSKIMLTFIHKFPGKEIIDARERTGSSRGTHYDFDIKIRNIGSSTEGEWKHVEHKGSKKYCPIKDTDKPWNAGVQFHNGGAEKYSLARKYAKIWYDMYIASDKLKTEWSISAPTPTYTEWFDKDCKTQSDPKTAFGKEIKEKVRAKHGPKSSLLAKRSAVNEELAITDEDMKTLIKEVLPIANQALEQKDYWLTIHGDLAGEFNCAWYPQFVIKTIEKVVITKKKDIEMDFHCSDDFTFRGILRWGSGAGFSNLRLDLK